MAHSATVLGTFRSGRVSARAPAARDERKPMMLEHGLSGAWPCGKPLQRRCVQRASHSAQRGGYCDVRVARLRACAVRRRNRDVHVAPRVGAAALQYRHGHERKANNVGGADGGLRHGARNSTRGIDAQVSAVRGCAAQHTRHRRRARGEARSTASSPRVDCARSSCSALRDRAHTRAAKDALVRVHHFAATLVTANRTFG